MYAVEVAECTVFYIVASEFSFGLFAEAFGVDEEEYAVHPAVFQQPVNLRDGGECLACARCHNYKCFGLVVGKRFGEVVDGINLTLAESLRHKCGKIVFEEVPHGVFLFHKPFEGFGTVKPKHFARAVFYVVVIGKLDYLVGGLVSKTDFVVGFDIFEGAVGVSCGLLFHEGEVFARFCSFGFDDPDGRFVHKKGIVHLAGACRIFPDSDTECGCNVHHFSVLNLPTRRLQFAVYLQSCFCFRIHSEEFFYNTKISFF